MRFKTKSAFPLVVFLVFILLFVYILYYLKPKSDLTTDSTSPIVKIDTNPYKNKLMVGSKEVKVEIADNEEETRLGLSNRESMCEDCGLYFDLGYKDTIPTFWMKDMKFAIDIIWIDDGEVVEITKNISAPEPGAKDYELTRYQPKQKIDYVLEVNSGYSEKNNITVGDSVSFSEK